MLSGPIDIDKMDYLARDSLHAGVPYGRHFDQARLIGSLCLNGSGDGIAITEKGRTAAELMVFARYVMFSEVYWHHGVRAATAMLQRAFYALRDSMDPETLFTTTEAEFIQLLRKTAAGSSKETDESHGGAAALLEGLFGPRRVLYKRVAQYSFFENEALYQLLARRDYRWLVRCAGEFAAVVRRRRDIAIQPHEVIFDAPPVALEVQFAVDVYFPKQDCYRPLGEVSPVVRTLAQEQFDDYVKRVRLFVHPRLRETLGSESEIESLLHETLEAVQDEG
jgi:HD superfamily phosphohydrolase